MQNMVAIHVNENYDPFVVNEFGDLVETCYGKLSVYLNNQFSSIPVALEYYGIEPAPMPNII